VPTPSQLQYLLTFAVDFARLCVWLVLLTAVLEPLERIWPLHPQKLFRKAFGTDLVYYFLSGFVPKLFLTLPLTALAAILHRMVPLDFYLWMAGCGSYAGQIFENLIEQAVEGCPKRGVMRCPRW